MHPVATGRLDSMAVMGHSGATGVLTDPDNPTQDVRENSWATGENPAVRSVYLRLLENHPAMRGHNYNVAVNGSRLADVEMQLRALLDQAEVLPDLVVIQTIDNDIRCNGTDPANYRPFGRTLHRALERIERQLPAVQVFLVSQFATVREYAETVRGIGVPVANNTGTGLCDLFDGEGRIRDAGVRYLQGIVDGYWAEVVRVCGRHPGCFTDAGALQTMEIEVDDLAGDFVHLSVGGHAELAKLAWRALPGAIRERP